MKFGRKYAVKPVAFVCRSHSWYSLPRNQVPEWASSYINYKGLKKLVKAAAATASTGEKLDLAGGRPLSGLGRG
jgi:hypothetical protein